MDRIYLFCLSIYSLFIYLVSSFWDGLYAEYTFVLIQIKSTSFSNGEKEKNAVAKLGLGPGT